MNISSVCNLSFMANGKIEDSKAGKRRPSSPYDKKTPPKDDYPIFSVMGEREAAEESRIQEERPLNCFI